MTKWLNRIFSEKVPFCGRHGKVLDRDNDDRELFHQAVEQQGHIAQFGKPMFDPNTEEVQQLTYRLRERNILAWPASQGSR